jgi:hypothetical protein
MGVFALETFDQAGQLRGDGARLAAVLARFGDEGLEAAVAVALGPFQQRIDGDGTTFGVGDVVVREAISSARRVSSPRGSGSSTSGAIRP